MNDDAAEDEESTTLDRDTAETGPDPVAEVVALPVGPWRDDERSLRDDRPRSSRPDAPLVRRARNVAGASSARIPASVIPPSSTGSGEYDFPDHSAASGALWPDDEEQAIGSAPEISARPSRRPSRRNPLALTGELPIASSSSQTRG